LFWKYRFRIISYPIKKSWKDFFDNQDPFVESDTKPRKIIHMNRETWKKENT